MAIVMSEGTLTALVGVPAEREVAWARYLPRLEPNYRNAHTLAGDFAAIYRTQPNVQTCVRVRARNMAQLGLHAFERVSTDERRRLEADHELSQVIRQPNRRMSRYRWVEALESDLCVFGNHFDAMIRRPSDGRLELLRLPPQYVRPLGGNWLENDAWALKYGDLELELGIDEVFAVNVYNPDNPRYGLSPLESLRGIINEELTSGRYRENYWRNAARIEGTLSHSKRLTADAARRIRDDWERLNTGEEASGRTAVLEEGMTFTPISFNARDSQYLEASKLRREVCAAALSVAPALVGILEHANFSNMREQHKSLYQDTLGPDLELVQTEFDLQVVPTIDGTAGVYTEFNIRDKLQGDFAEEASVLQTATGGPYMKRNEARARLNLPPVDGGDELITPLNVIVGGQASPTDSAPKSLAIAGDVTPAMLRAAADELERTASNGHK